MMFKLLVISVVALSVVTLAGCKAKNKADTTGDGTNNAQEQAQANVVENGDVVRVDYVGSTQEDGVFDTSIQTVAQEEGLYTEFRSYEPLEFTVGAQQMIPGFEQGVIGMKEGETKTLTITPEQGYGEVREDLVQELPKSNFTDQGIEPKVGETYNFGMAQGKVLEVTDDKIKIDFNHFLAGKTLTFEVTIREVIKKDTVADSEAAADTEPTAEEPAANDEATEPAAEEAPADDAAPADDTATN